MRLAIASLACCLVVASAQAAAGAAAASSQQKQQELRLQLQSIDPAPPAQVVPPRPKSCRRRRSYRRPRESPPSYRPGFIDALGRLLGNSKGRSTRRSAGPRRRSEPSAAGQGCRRQRVAIPGTRVITGRQLCPPSSNGAPDSSRVPSRCVAPKDSRAAASSRSRRRSGVRPGLDRRARARKARASSRPT